MNTKSYLTIRGVMIAMLFAIIATPILADDEATARRRAAALRGPGTRIWLAAEDVPDLARLELVEEPHPFLSTGKGIPLLRVSGHPLDSGTGLSGPLVQLLDQRLDPLW